MDNEEHREWERIAFVAGRELVSMKLPFVRPIPEAINTVPPIGKACWLPSGCTGNIWSKKRAPEKVRGLNKRVRLSQRVQIHLQPSYVPRLQVGFGLLAATLPSELKPGE